MNESKPMQTGVPSADRPWMQYYPPQLIENLEIPEQTIGEYLRTHCPGDDVVAMHYYGNDITWKQLFEQVDATARGLKALGLGEGDAIPTFLRAVPVSCWENIGIYPPFHLLASVSASWVLSRLWHRASRTVITRKSKQKDAVLENLLKHSVFCVINVSFLIFRLHRTAQTQQY